MREDGLANVLGYAQFPKARSNSSADVAELERDAGAFPEATYVFRDAA